MAKSYIIGQWSMQFGLSYGVHKLLHHIFIKWPPAAILVFRFSSKSIGFFHFRSLMAVSNMNVMSIGVAVTWNTSLGVRRRRRPDQKHNIPEISNFGDIIISQWICLLNRTLPHQCTKSHMFAVIYESCIIMLIFQYNTQITLFIINIVSHT